MTINYIEEMDYLVGMLSTMKLMFDSGKGEGLFNAFEKVRFDPEYQYELFWEALMYASDFYDEKYHEDDDATEYTLSDKVVTEYYVLCKQYGRRKRIRFKDNPYVKKADDYVTEQMNAIRDYGIGWNLFTKTTGEYTSALNIWLYPGFIQTVELIESILDVFDFYEKEIQTLRAELAPKTKIQKVSFILNEKEAKAA